MNGAYFFLHYGPGGNCDAERAYFKNASVRLHFWDQPAARTFDELNEAVTSEFARFVATHKCLGIVGHSFGCDLAMNLANQQAKIGLRVPVILVAPIPNLISAFENLARCSAKQKDMKADLRQTIIEKLRALSTSRGERQVLWDLVFTIYGYPNVGRLFWYSDQAFLTFAQNARAYRAVDLTTWQNVLSDYISNHEPALSRTKLALTGDMTKVCLGSADPYLDDAMGASFWSQLIKKDNVLNFTDAAHYAHLEKIGDFIKFLTATDDK